MAFAALVRGTTVKAFRISGCNENRVAMVSPSPPEPPVKGRIPSLGLFWGNAKTEQLMRRAIIVDFFSILIQILVGFSLFVRGIIMSFMNNIYP